jgi:hypothetical protein
VPDDSLPGAILLAVLFLYPFYEGFVVHRFRTTPGKLLMNVRLVERAPTSLAESNGRAISAHFGGYFGGIPLLAQAAAYLAYRRFLATGRTNWDDESTIYASPHGAGLARWLAFSALAVFFIFLSVLGQTPDGY